ncbi:MAG: ester cyclase [Candidatus Palauibacterales bacterium]|nr:ester cyclase [Candidatus Palauibacterales bacterium]MDP2529558.1 ester cyclase [Candidatus Palauibacterales bacterium]MDP2583516.1 ester cyclase [Candidatus Palauibacterales bacterium]
MSEHKKAVVGPWTDVWNGADPSKLREFTDPDIHFESSGLPGSDGIDGLVEVITELRRAFPDGEFVTHEVIAEGDTVVNRWTFRGTQKGEWMGRPGTGRSVEVNGTSTNHFRNGKVVEHLADWNSLGMMQQLGVIEL